MKDNIDNEEAQKEDLESLEYVDSEESEIENEDGVNKSDGRVSWKTRLSVLEELGVSDDDFGISYRYDRKKGIVKFRKVIGKLRRLMNLGLEDELLWKNSLQRN